MLAFRGGRTLYSLAPERTLPEHRKAHFIISERSENNEYHGHGGRCEWHESNAKFCEYFKCKNVRYFYANTTS